MKIVFEIKKINENKIKEILIFYDVNIFKKKKVKCKKITSDKNINKKIENISKNRNCITVDYIKVNPSLFNIKK